jgi:SAM-dependent methyltransferase
MVEDTSISGLDMGWRKWLGRRSELYYEEIGPDFDRFMSDYDVERRAALIQELLPRERPARTLEVGCGTGAITRTYRDSVDDLIVTDISGRLASATAAANGALGRAEDAMSLSFADASFDLVISSECIEHVPEPARAVGEMLRVLRPGGRLVLTTPNRLWLPVVAISQILRIRRFQGNERFLSTRELRAAVVAGGGDVLRHTGCHLVPWQIPGIKPLLRRLDRFGHQLHPIMINQAIAAEKRRSARRADD